MIIDDIRNSQLGNQQAMLDLVERFTPALKKYARKLETEDALNDLVLEFLEVILHLDCSSIRQQGDGAMVNYLSRSINCSYIKLLNRLIKNKIPCVQERISQMHCSTNTTILKCWMFSHLSCQKIC